MAEVYCDEAGYTGNNLINPEQPHFVFAAATVDQSEAAQAISDAVVQYRLQMPEVKGGKLMKSTKGKIAALSIIKKFNGNVNAIYIDKDFALAAKYYEYMIEPLISEKNDFFYNIQFHRFISHTLCKHFKEKQLFSREIYVAFESCLREKNLQKIDHLFSQIATDNRASGFLRKITSLYILQRDVIESGLESVWQTESIGSWILELTATSLHRLLGELSGLHPTLDVYCDDSKPLHAQSSIFDAMINRDDRIIHNVAGSMLAITYNISGPVKLVDSKIYPGIQIADIFASALAYALKNAKEKFSRECLTAYTNKLFRENSLQPEYQFADTTSWQGFLNDAILTHFLEKSAKKADPLDGVPETIIKAQRAYSRR